MTTNQTHGTIREEVLNMSSTIGGSEKKSNESVSEIKCTNLFFTLVSKYVVLLIISILYSYC